MAAAMEEDIEEIPNLKVIDNGVDLGLHKLPKKEIIQDGELVFVPHANTNFCLAKIVLAHALAKKKNGTDALVRVSKIHFLGWNFKEDMYVLQDELYEVSVEAFQTKLRVASLFNQPITGGEIRALRNTCQSKGFTNYVDLDALRRPSSNATRGKVHPKGKENLVKITPNKEATNSKAAKSEPRRPSSVKRGAEPLLSEKKKDKRLRFEPPKPISGKKRTRPEAALRVKAPTQPLVSPLARRQTPSQKKEPNQESSSRVSRQLKPIPDANKGEGSKTSQRGGRVPSEQSRSEKTPAKRRRTSVVEIAPKKTKIESKKAIKNKDSEPLVNLAITEQPSTKGKKPTDKNLPLVGDTKITKEIEKKRPVARPKKESTTATRGQQSLRVETRDAGELVEQESEITKPPSMVPVPAILSSQSEVSHTPDDQKEEATKSTGLNGSIPPTSPRVDYHQAESDTTEVFSSSEPKKPDVQTSDREMGQSQRPRRTTKSIYRRDPQPTVAPKKESEKSEVLREIPTLETDLATSSAPPATCSSDVNQVEPIESTLNGHRTLDKVTPEVEPEAIIGEGSFAAADSQDLDPKGNLPQETNDDSQEITTISDSDEESSSEDTNQDSDEVFNGFQVEAEQPGPSDWPLSKQTPLFGIPYNPNKDGESFEISPVQSAAELSTSELKEEIEYLAGYARMLETCPPLLKCRICQTLVNKTIFIRHVLAHLREKKCKILPFTHQYDMVFHEYYTTGVTYANPFKRTVIDMLPTLGYPPRLMIFAKQRIRDVNNVAPSYEIGLRYILATRQQILKNMEKIGKHFGGFSPEELKCFMCNETFKTPAIYDHIFREMFKRNDIVPRHYVEQTHAVFHHAGVCDAIFDARTKEYLDENGRLPQEDPDFERLYKKCPFPETGTF